MNGRNKELRTERLRIVPESMEDAGSIHEVLGLDPELSRYTGWNPYRTLEETEEKIRRDLSGDNGSFSWVIRRDGIFLGTIGAYDYDSGARSIEIGYTIGRMFWGQGYAGEAVSAVIRFLLSRDDICSVRAWSHEENEASIRVLRSAGFRETGRDGEHIVFEKNTI